jgi:ferredoxin-NADP reductase
MEVPMLATTAPSLLQTLLRSPWLRPLNDLGAIDDLLSLLDPLWSLGAIRARVVEVRRETATATTLVLKTNGHWPGHAPGQHVQVEVEIDGRRRRRTFSVSSAPTRDGLVHVTVQKREDGPVSGWWNGRARVGDLLTLSPPSGEFVLPSPLPPRVVMLAAGSGITPLMAMLRSLRGRSPEGHVTLVLSARTPAAMIFRDEIAEMASEGTWLAFRPHDSATDGRLDAEALGDLAREAGDAPVFACGPTGFVEAVRTAWAAVGRAAQVRVESFGPPRRPLPTGKSGTVTVSSTGRTFVASAGQTLLEAAESAGLRPAHGCRAGICHACKCRKLDGVAEDLRDGRLLVEAGETIQLCVTAARGAVTLDL